MRFLAPRRVRFVAPNAQISFYNDATALSVLFYFRPRLSFVLDKRSAVRRHTRYPAASEIYR